MKLASLKDGQDGCLVVVSNDLAWCARAEHIAPTLQAALDDWSRCEPDLRGLAESLEHGSTPRERFHERQAASPLPRAFLAPRDPLPLDRAHAVDAEVAVVTGEVAAGASREEALAAIRLVMLGDARGGGEQAAAFSPVAVTPDALDGWRDGRLSGPIELELNGRPVGQAKAPIPADTDFGALVAAAARARGLAAGSIVWAGDGAPRTDALKPGDVVRIEMRDSRRHTVFGAIEQEVSPA